MPDRTETAARQGLAAATEIDALRREASRLRGMMEGSYRAAAAAQEETGRLRVALAAAEATGALLRKMRTRVEDEAEKARVAALVQAEAQRVQSHAESEGLRASLLAEADRMRAETEQVLAALEHAQEALRHRNADMAALHASTSWRVTAPLRRVVRGLRGG